MKEQRKSYPSDVSDEEWAFCVRYLALMTEEAPQRVYPLREIFNALRNSPRSALPPDAPPLPIGFPNAIFTNQVEMPYTM